jgi:hypothetical protein
MKLLRAWNGLEEGDGVTMDPEEAAKTGALLIGEIRLRHLRAEGFLPTPEDDREIPVEEPIPIVRTLQKGGA